MANKTFLEQAESPISVISWHSGKLARVARSSYSAELQAAADAEGELRLHSPFLERTRRRNNSTSTLAKRQMLRSQVHWCWILLEKTMHLHEVNQLVWVLKDKRSALEDGVDFGGHIRLHSWPTA